MRNLARSRGWSSSLGIIARRGLLARFYLPREGRRWLRRMKSVAGPQKGRLKWPGCERDGMPQAAAQTRRSLRRARLLSDQGTRVLELGACFHIAPALGRCTESRLVRGSIVERNRVEVGPTRPNDGMNLRVERDLSKRRRVAQRAVKLALKNRLKINGARQAIVEAQAQRIQSDVLAGRDAVDRPKSSLLLPYRSAC